MQKNKTNKKTFWPYGILISFALIVASCVMTVILALDHPVHMDNYYFESLENVDRNYNEIQDSQERFDKKYSVGLLKDSFDLHKDINLQISVLPKTQNSDKLNFKLLITRPETSEFDISPNAKFNGNILELDSFKAPKVGRWRVDIKLNDGKDTGFYRMEFIAYESKS